MNAAPAPSSATVAPRRRGVVRFGAGALALLAHLAVGASWALTAAAVMGLLGIGRRILMNSEWAFDTGRLPQPWVIAVGAVAIAASHLFFRWAMRRAGDGVAAYGPSVVAWSGALLGVLWGVYNWAPPVQVGVKVGPAAGHSTPWDVLGWAAYHARLALPALIGLITAGLILVSRHSPLRVALRWLGRRRIVARERRAARRTAQAQPAGGPAAR